MTALQADPGSPSSCIYRCYPSPEGIHPQDAPVPDIRHNKFCRHLTPSKLFTTAVPSTRMGLPSAQVTFISALWSSLWTFTRSHSHDTKAPVSTSHSTSPPPVHPQIKHPAVRGSTQVSRCTTVPTQLVVTAPASLRGSSAPCPRPGGSSALALHGPCCFHLPLATLHSPILAQQDDRHLHGQLPSLELSWLNFLLTPVPTPFPPAAWDSPS